MNKTIRMLLCLVVCGILVLNSVHVCATESSPWLSYIVGDNSSTTVVVSLGDSYSAGEGIQPYYGQNSEDGLPSGDWVAHRSELSWPGLLEINGIVLNEIKADSVVAVSSSDVESGAWSYAATNTLGETKYYAIDFTDYHAEITGNAWYFAAVSGAKCENVVPLYGDDSGYQHKVYVYNSSDGLYYDYYYNYQINTITSMSHPEAIDYVTLTIGGNDAGFVDILTEAVTGSTLVNMSADGMRGKILNVIDSFWESSGLGETLKTTYIKIMEAAPSATLIVAGYPQLINLEHGVIGVSTEEAVLINIAVSIFDLYISQIVTELQDSGYSILFADVQEMFEGNEASSVDWDTYITGLTFIGADENYDFIFTVDETAGTVENLISSYYTLMETGDLNGYTSDFKSIISDLVNNVSNFVSSASFHPNEAGAQAYASAVQKVINEFEKDKSSLDATSYYEYALELLKSLDSFSMDINIEMIINTKENSISKKTITEFDASCLLENYGKDNYSITGSATLTEEGLDYAYDMHYENGMAYYNYTKPIETSTSYVMSFDLMAFETFDVSAITNAEIVSSDGGEIVLEITVDGEIALENGVQLFPEVMDLSNVSCSDIIVTNLIDAKSR